MSIKQWFQSWWWPCRIGRLQTFIAEQHERMTGLQLRLEEVNIAFRKAESEAERMRQKWMDATRELQHAKEQAVDQKHERRAIYEQRDECRRLLMAAMGKDNVPEWVVNPYTDMEARMKAGNA